MASKPNGRNVAQDSVQGLITREEWDRWAAASWEIATSGTKPEWAHCPKCNVKIRLDRVDLMARVNAAKQLQEMGFGKPKDDSEGRQGFVLNRMVVAPSGVSGDVEEGHVAGHAESWDSFAAPSSGCG